MSEVAKTPIYGPDGSLIAFVIHEQGERNLYATYRAATQQEKVADGTAYFDGGQVELGGGADE